MKHVTWIYPDDAEDHSVHFLYDSEWTFCGAAFEGVTGNPNQGFIETKNKVTCDQCINRVLKAKEVKKTEIL